MVPALEDGAHFLVARGTRAAPGEVVLLQDPRTDTPLIKRVASLTQEGEVIVLGDNPSASTDSRQFGPVPTHRILGKVTGRLGGR